MCREGTSFCRAVSWWVGSLYSLDSLFVLEIWKLPCVGNNLRLETEELCEHSLLTEII